MNDPAGPPPRLAGNNFAATREIALLTSADEVHETDLAAAVRRTGGLIRMVECAVVRHVRRFGAGQAMADRFRFGLEYGGLRARRLRPAARLVGSIAGPAILGAQLGRLGWTVLRNRRYLGRCIRTLPITLALLSAWSLGEWAGWSLGSLGRSDRPA